VGPAGLLLWAQQAGDVDRMLHCRRSAAVACGKRMRAVPHCQHTYKAEHRLVTEENKGNESREKKHKHKINLNKIQM